MATPGLAPSTQPRMRSQRRSRHGATARSPSSAPTSKQSSVPTGGRTRFPEHPSRFTWNAGPEPPPSRPPAGADGAGLLWFVDGEHWTATAVCHELGHVASGSGHDAPFRNALVELWRRECGFPPLRNCAPSSTAGYPPPDTTQPLGEVRVEPSHPVDSQPVWNGERTRTSPHIVGAIPMLGDRNRWRHRRVGSATSMACSVRPGRQCAPHTLRGPP